MPRAALFKCRPHDCIAGCDKEFGRFNPKRYVCRNYCQYSCTDTPDTIDTISGLPCDVLTSPCASSATACICDAVGIADILANEDLRLKFMKKFATPLTVLDCLCDLMTTFHGACNGNNVLSMALIITSMQGSCLSMVGDIAKKIKKPQSKSLTGFLLFFERL